MTEQSDSDQGVGPTPGQGPEWAWAQDPAGQPIEGVNPDEMIEAIDAEIARMSEPIQGLSPEGTIEGVGVSAEIPVEAYAETPETYTETAPETYTEVGAEAEMETYTQAVEAPAETYVEMPAEQPAESVAEPFVEEEPPVSFVPANKPLEWPEELDPLPSIPRLSDETEGVLPDTASFEAISFEAAPAEANPVQANPVEVNAVQENAVQEAPVQAEVPVQPVAAAQPEPAQPAPAEGVAAQGWPEVTQLLPRTTGDISAPTEEVPVMPDFSSDIFRDSPQAWPQQTVADDDEERKLAAERAARREARLRALSAPAAEPAAPPAPVVVTKRTTDKFIGSFGLFILRLITAAVFGIRGFQLLANRAASEQQFSVSLLPEPQIWVLAAGFGSLLVALALVLGLLTRVAGLGAMLIALGDLIFFQYSAAWSPFVEGMPGVLGEVQLLAVGIGLVFLCVGGGGWSFDRSVRSARERGKDDRLLDEDDE